MYKIVFVSIVLFASCGEKTGDSRLNSEPDCSNMVDVEKWANEILDIDSVLIDGQMKVITSKSEIIDHFGRQIEELKISSPEFLSYLLAEDTIVSATKIFFKKAAFEGVNDKYILSRMDLAEHSLYINENLSFSKGMYARDLCEMYPESCKLVITAGNGWNGYIELRVSKKPVYEDMRWFLIIRNEALESIELHRFL